jgi:glucosamine-6-phosphate deaminase
MNGDPSSPAILVFADAQQVAQQVAQMIAEAIRAKPDIVLGLATGATPIGVYSELVRLHRESSLDFSRVRTFNLDEYIGLGPDHPQSYRAFMRQHLFDHVNLGPGRTHLPEGLTSDVAAHAREYEAMIQAAGGIDLQLLGIGDNGHIAFNEPGSLPDSRTRQIELTEATIAANARFFASEAEVPRHAITMGIGTILEARRVILMATGQRKSQAVRRALEGPIDVDSPASQLRRGRNVIFALDRAAASQLSSQSIRTD